MKRCALVLLLLLLAAPAWAAEEPSVWAYGVAGSVPEDLRHNLLTCPPQAYNGNRRLRLTVYPDARTQSAFAQAMRENDQAQGVWVDVDIAADRRLVMLYQLDPAGAMQRAEVHSFDPYYERACDAVGDTLWTLADPPLSELALEYLDHARRAFAAGDYDAADGHYRDLLVVAPHAAIACREAGRMWLHGDKPGLSAGWYAAAKEYAPYDFLTALELSSYARERGDTTEAVRLFEEAMDLAPRTPARLTEFAALLRDDHRYAEAQQALAEAVAADPDNRVALLALMEAAANNEDWPTAAASLQKLLADGEVDDRQRRMLAYYQTKAGDYAGAMTTLDDLHQRHPDDPEIAADLRRLHLALGRYEVVEPLLVEHLATHPEDVDALRDLAQIYFQTKRFDQAAAMLERAVALQPYNEDLQRLLGKAYELAGNESGALDSYARFLERKKNFTGHDLERYLALARKLDRRGEAIARLDELGNRTRRRESKVLIVATVARLEEERGNVDRAIELLQQALREPTAQGATHFELGRIYLKRGDVTQAAIHFGQMNAPDAEPAMLLTAARLMQHAGRRDRAVDLFGMAYRRDNSLTLAGVLYFEGLLLEGRDESNDWLQWQLSKDIVRDVEREQLCWLELFYAAEKGLDDFYRDILGYTLRFIALRPQTNVDLSMWPAVVEKRIPTPRRAELLDLLRVFARTMKPEDFAAKYKFDMTEPSPATE